MRTVAVDDDDDAAAPALKPRDWCQFDTGRATVTGRAGVDAYISVRRDGTVWLRLGVDGASSSSTFDWSLVDVRRPRVQMPVVGQWTRSCWIDVEKRKLLMYFLLLLATAVYPVVSVGYIIG